MKPLSINKARTISVRPAGPEPARAFRPYGFTRGKITREFNSQ
jgi:hypothetical protein